MNNFWQWFFTIVNTILALSALYIGIWDLKVDLKDYDQDNPPKGDV